MMTSSTGRSSPSAFGGLFGDQDVSTSFTPHFLAVKNHSDLDPDLGGTGGFIMTPGQYFALVKGIVAVRAFICLGGMVGNIVNIRAFLRIGLEDSVTTTFFSLALSDLLLLASVFTATIATLCESFENDFNIIFPLRAFYVKLTALVFSRPFHYITSMFTMILAVQRCLCVAIPLQFKGVFTRARTLVIVLLVWAYGLTCGFMILSQYRFKRQFVSATNSSLIIMIRKPAIRSIMAYLSIANGTVLSSSSIVVIFICLVIMAYVLKRSIAFRQKASSAREVAPTKESHVKGADETKIKTSGLKERHVIVQVSLVSAIFLVTSLPYVMMSIATFIIPDLDRLGTKYHYIYSALYDSKVTVEIVNSSVNFFVYYKYNTKFRQVCFGQKLK